MHRGAASAWSRLPVLGMSATLLLVLAAEVGAQQAPPINGIYTCTDANGRKLRSDRPIPACLDREQTVLNPSGTVRARVGPSLSAQQRAEIEERKKDEALERARELDDKRRDRAMLARYPAREAHDKERAEAHARLDSVVMEAEKRIVALHEERKKIDRELEFYQGDPAKAPPALRRQIDYVAQGLQAQRRFTQAQENERQRIDARFNEELQRLKELWQEQQRVGGPAPRADARP
jgi:hypothetical protein